MNSSKDIPFSLKTPLKYKNEKIQIYCGEFKLIENEKEVIINGQIYFSWLDLRVKYLGESVNSNFENPSKFLAESYDFELIFQNQNLGKVNTYSFSHIYCIKGETIGSSIINNKVEPINEYFFVIPNFKNYHGIITKKIKSKRISTDYNRIEFSCQKYKLIIDRQYDYEENLKNIRTNRRSFVTNIGKIEKLKGNFDYPELYFVLERFSLFLSFLNSAGTSTILVHSIFNGKISYIDYTEKKVNSFEENYNWWFRSEIKNTITVWNKILESNNTNYKYINSLINWYTESMNKNINIEAKIILAQTGLELMFNWFHLLDKFDLSNNKANGL